MDLWSLIDFNYKIISTNVILAFSISSVCIAVIGLYYHYKNLYSYWEKRGIKGPKPLPPFGNLLQHLLSNRMKLEKEWLKKYGKVYGIYLGSKPRLVIADPEVLQQICIKDFDAFTNHDSNEFSNQYQKAFLFFLQDDHWKKVRALMSPTFTSGKIKRMFKFLDGCADDLVQCVNEQLPEKGVKSQRTSIVNVKDLYSLFAMDAISTCCYGLKLERAGSANLKTVATRNDFVDGAMKIFDFSILRLLVAASIPKFILSSMNFKIVPERVNEPLAQKVTHLINGRRNSAKKFDDYLQLLIDAKLDDQMELNEMDLAENHHAGLTKESLLEDQKKMVGEVESHINSNASKIILSEIEIVSGGIFLLAVGLETTGTLLAHCTYALAFHQEIQMRLNEEVKKIAGYKGVGNSFSFNYDSLTSCRYLDAVLSETLRHMAPVLLTDRVANRNYNIEKYNIDITKGDQLSLGLYAILNDADNWDEPEKFNPERFMPGNKERIVPGSYCPFGIGPRHCVGMRFSLTEAKLALAKMIMNFRFEPAPKTVFPPELKMTLGLTRLKDPSVTVIPRV